MAEELALPQHVLRFWESKFPQVKPVKRGGGRRYYRPEDVDLLRASQSLLYDDKFTIKGVQKLLREQGPKTLAATVGQQPFEHAALDDTRSGRGQEDREPILRDILAELEAIRSLLRTPSDSRV